MDVKNSERVNRRNMKCVGLVGAIALVGIVTVLYLVCCETQNDEANHTGFRGDMVSPGGTVAEEHETVDADKATDEEVAYSDVVSGSASGDVSSSSGLARSQSYGSSVNTVSPNVSASKVWVEDTEQRWVVDRAAWTEEVPVYATAERSICNVCSQDITGNVAAHGKAHMMAGENSGHHSEVTRYVSHYETIEHAEEGHWETVVVGGHWE